MFLSATVIYNLELLRNDSAFLSFRTTSTHKNVKKSFTSVITLLLTQFSYAFFRLRAVGFLNEAVNKLANCIQFF